MSSHAHKEAARDLSLRVAIVTLSDTRTPQTDTSGTLIQTLVTAAGHGIADYAILPDDAEQLREHIQALVAKTNVDALLTTGGTGISRRDSTYDAIVGLLDKRLDGFGELFRMLSYQEIGAAAMLSRAVAGVHRGLLIFSMPGSTKAVRLAMEKLILPELPHLAWELRR